MLLAMIRRSIFSRLGVCCTSLGKPAFPTDEDGMRGREQTHRDSRLLERVFRQGG